MTQCTYYDHTVCINWRGVLSCGARTVPGALIQNTYIQIDINECAVVISVKKWKIGKPSYFSQCWLHYGNKIKLEWLRLAARSTWCLVFRDKHMLPVLIPPPLNVDLKGPSKNYEDFDNMTFILPIFTRNVYIRIDMSPTNKLNSAGLN